MAYNIFNDSISTSGDIELGKRLTNIKNLNISQPRFSVYDSNNAVTTYAFNPGIASILNQASLDALKTTLLENTEEAIVFKSDSNNQILFHTGLNSGIPDASNLRLEITDTNTKINNNLLVDTIKRKSDNTDAISLGSTTMTLQKPMTIFRDSTNYGYMRIQNSINTKSGYLDWMTGSGSRIAYMGLGENNNGITKINNSLTLGLENQCNFSINDDTTTIFKVSLEDDTIDLNYTTNANGNFIMKDDNAHKEINNNNNLPLLKLPSGQNYSANLYGEDANNGLILSKTPLLFKLDAKVAGADVDLYISKIQTDTLTANTSVSSPLIKTQFIKSNQTNGEIYIEKEDQTSRFRLVCDANHYIQTVNNIITFSKWADPQVGLKLHHTNSTCEIPYNLISPTINTANIRFTGQTTDAITLSSGAIQCSKDLNIGNTFKVHFASNNYFANDGNNNLNMFINSNKNFVANTGNDKSIYEFQINNNCVLKMSRDLTSNPISNRTQISSQSLLLEDDGVLGGTLELVRTGASSAYSGYINYNNFLGRVFYTGFNSDSVTLGQPIHYMEDVCRSYTFKNSLGNIMKIISHSGTLSASSNYVEISNSLDCPTINTTNIRFTGETTNSILLKADEIRLLKPMYMEWPAKKFSIQGGATDNLIYERNGLNLGYNISYTPSTEDETATTTSLYTSKVLIDNGGVSLQVSNTVNALPSNVLVASNTLISCYKTLAPNGTRNLGGTSTRWNNIYGNNLNSNTGIFNTNLQTPSLISSSNTSTYQSRLDMDDLLATFVCRDVAGVEKSILIGSYSALVSNVQITANQGILMNNTFNSRNITPTSDDTYNLGSLSQRYNDIYATNGNIETSDRNMKKDIQPIQNGLETIMKLKPVSYKFINGKSGRIHTGYIAQDCKDTYVKDWAGYIENEGRFGLRYTEFISLNTQAIKELYKLFVNQKTPIQDGGEHKCAGVYNLEQDIEQLCQSKDALEQELFKFKTQNDILEQRIIELENIDYRQQPVEPTSVGNNDELVLLKNRIDILEERDMLADSDATQTSQLDIIMSRLNLLENENKKLKVKVAKQTTIINKILTSK